MTDLKNRDKKSLLFRFYLINRNTHLLFLGTVLVCLFFSSTGQAQEVKKIDKVKAFFNNETHSAAKATVYSAIIPGWGQAYNRKYWKLPIVYAGFGTVGYFVKFNHDQYKLYKNDFFLLKDDPNAETVSGKTEQEIRINIDGFRRNRDLSIIGLFAWYGLVLIDANVDGHFFNYDVDEDLTMGIEPWLGGWEEMNRGVGVSLNFRWK